MGRPELNLLRLVHFSWSHSLVDLMLRCDVVNDENPKELSHRDRQQVLRRHLCRHCHHQDLRGAQIFHDVRKRSHRHLFLRRHGELRGLQM